MGSRDVAWVVDHGSAAVSVVDFENGEPKGVRRYLFTVKSGDVLLGMSGARGSRHKELIAVAIESARVSPIAADEVAVTAWVSSLSSALAGLAPPDGAAPLPVDRQIYIEAGDSAFANDTVAWLRTIKGSIRLLGYPEGKIDQPGVPFLLGPGMWIEADEPTELERVAGGEKALESLAVLEPIIFRAFDDLDHRREEENRSHLRRRQELDRRLAAQTERDLASLTSGEVTRIEFSSDPPLLAAARTVGQAEGIVIKPASSDSYQRDPLEAIAIASAVRTRRVLLAARWWQGENGSLLAYQGEQNRPVALIQVRYGRSHGYDLFDPAAGSVTPVDASVAAALHPVAYSFYRPLGPALGTWDLIKLSTEFHRKDIATIVLCGIAASLLGMAAPEASSILFSQAIPDGDRSLLWQVAIGMGVALLGGMLFEVTQSVSMLRVQTAAGILLQTGMWDRLLKLSPAFFRKFTIGDLRARVEGVSTIQHLLTLEGFRTIVAGVFSSLYLLLMLYYSIPLGLIALAAGIVVIGGTAFAAHALTELEGSLQAMEGDLSGLTIQLINAVPKLRVAGAERRAYAFWGKSYTSKQKVMARIRAVLDRMRVLNVSVPLLAIGFSFWFALSSLSDASGSLPLGTFIAFNLALGVFMSAVTNLSGTLIGLVPILSIWRRTRSILDATPDVEDGQAYPGRLQGRIVFDRVSFRYRKDGPLTLEDINISVQPGECVALVGPSGSGKSTIVNLILRFETPSAGAIYVDGQNLAGIDISAVRRQMGVVSQDSKLMSESIFENIVCGGLSTMEDAWEAARAAGLAEDIEQMPMGMHTIVSEGGSNLSGGQRQRIMIARALVMKAAVLIFDEATSALDNQTQNIVTESLNQLKVTRVVVAHRLSTIRNADKIYVIENGRVVQQGKYEQLMDEPGLFAQLMKRQMVAPE
ncbi:MAG: NHLP bacteriocin export ABC transporter permease/ATPase subunit [Acidipila sp.]|nr:NHLP bacteriocin export ABC transporter permease/ATPase subunit [Acidipila sp.]